MSDILRTKYDLEVQIDDTVYKFIFKPVNKKIEEELNLLRNESVKNFEATDEKRAELRDLKELKILNEEILKDENYTSKASVYKEQKELILKISNLEKELKSLGDDREKVTKSLEEYYKKAFDLCVVGEGKVAFQKIIEDTGISYLVVNEHINKALNKAIEKK